MQWIRDVHLFGKSHLADIPPLLEIEWTLDQSDVINSNSANMDGLISFSSAALTLGPHTIELKVTDTVGFTSEAQLHFTINGLPSTPTAEITPSAPRTSNDLIAQTFGSIDPEGAVVSYEYQWLKNGSATNITTSSVSSSLTAKDEIWTLVATPSDGIGSGIAAQTSTKIENTPPTLSTPVISPSSGVFTDSTLLCSATVTDPDETPTQSYSWQKDGVGLNYLPKNMGLDTKFMPQVCNMG